MLGVGQWVMTVPVPRAAPRGQSAFYSLTEVAAAVEVKA